MGAERMKRKKRNLEADTATFSLASVPFSQNNEIMIFPSYNGLSSLIFLSLHGRVGPFLRSAAHRAVVFSPRSLIAASVI
jgi:ABC-type molybdate transport system permease subunit